MAGTTYTCHRRSERRVVSEAEINQKCAERLRWKKTPDKFYYDGIAWEKDGERIPTGDLADFYGSMDAAMQLVEKAKEWGWSWEPEWHPTDNFNCRFVRLTKDETGEFDFTDEVISESNKSPSAAICLAFLKLPEPAAERKDATP